MKLNIYYHKSSSGREFVYEYIESLDKDTENEINAFLRKFRDDYRFRRSPHFLKRKPIKYLKKI